MCYLRRCYSSQDIKKAKACREYLRKRMECRNKIPKVGPCLVRRPVGLHEAGGEVREVTESQIVWDF